MTATPVEGQGAPRTTVVVSLPFRGTWRARMSPARRVPSHGTDLFAATYAIDFIAVDGTDTAAVRDWRTMLSTEPLERFFAFGQPVLAPADGRVVAVRDGLPDGVARRSLFARVPYALSQASRARGGPTALAGNHLILDLADQPGHVVLAHLRAGSIRVRVGERVRAGRQVGACGNSGNSTQPHIHFQAMDGADPMTARGLPVRFTDYRVVTDGRRPSVPVEHGVPGEWDVVEPA